MAEAFSVVDPEGNPVGELGGVRVVKYEGADGRVGYSTAAYKLEGGEGNFESIYGAYDVIRAETSEHNPESLRYKIPNIPLLWELDKEADLFVVAIAQDGRIAEPVAQAYLSYDSNAQTLTVGSVFGEEYFCVYVFRNEQAANLFAIQSDGKSNLSAILGQFRKEVRVLRQLQALTKRGLRCPDPIETLPDAPWRKGKILSFDENGQPSLSGDLEEIRGAYAARDEAVDAAASANEEARLAENAQRAAETARDSAQGFAASANDSAASAAQNAVKSSGFADDAKISAQTSEEAHIAALAASESAQTAQAAAEDARDRALAAYASMGQVYDLYGNVVPGRRAYVVPVLTPEGKFSFMVKEFEE